ncbi:MAG: AMP-binding protein [Egibacteraceae bacterium]
MTARVRRARQRPMVGGDLPDTFPKLLMGLAACSGDRVALQEKRYGIWQATTWRRYSQRVRDLAHGLADLGVEPGEVVAVLSDNRPEWLIAELAAQSLGACVVGIYPTSLGDEVRHILGDGRVRVVIAADQEQVDKLVGLWDEIPSLQTLIFFDPRGLERYDRPYLVELCEVEARGRAVERDRPGWLDDQIAAGRGGDIAVICTTSGTTGRPKLAMLSHANLLSVGRGFLQMDAVGPDDRYVSFLPFAWIGEQMLTVACGMQAGFTTSFCEDAETVRADLREIGPDVLLSPPRIFQDMVALVQVRLGEADLLKRAVFRWAHRMGERVADRRVQSQPVGVPLRALHRLADWVALRPVRDQLGLTRLRWCYTGGAPLGPDVFRFFHALGINLRQIYGQTEICGTAVAHRDGDIRFHTVGVPIPGTELRIADSGEILLRSPSVFHGYYGDDEATAAAVDADGWLHTGDAGYLDDGHLVVIDRAKDVMDGPDGTRFSPAFVENKLKFSPFVEEAVVFGSVRRPHLVAVLTIDAQAVGMWAERRRLGFTTYTDLAQKPEVYQLIAGEVDRFNADLPEAIRVRRFVLLHKPLDADDHEITRTRKIRRGVIAERYGSIVGALHGADGAVTITSVIAYQDGSSVEREIQLRLMSMDGFTPAPVRPRRTARSVR